jgi:hypothetical protein
MHSHKYLILAQGPPLRWALRKSASYYGHKSQSSEYHAYMQNLCESDSYTTLSPRHHHYFIPSLQPTAIMPRAVMKKHRWISAPSTALLYASPYIVPGLVGRLEGEQHKQNLRLLNVGHGGMQVRTEVHTGQLWK